MNVNVFLRIGKEINEQTRNTIIKAFESKNLTVNTGKIGSDDRVGFIIRSKVADTDLFVKHVYEMLQQIPCLYLVAPQKSLEQIKHHPHVHCFDSSFLEDPEACALNLISIAYHGRPL